MRGDWETLRSFASRGQKCLTSLLPNTGDAHVETDEGTNPVDISLFGW